ncbi:IclR family transcriptional regulator [Asticcacaulis sp. AC460]|uniref:IclR family transcriptional regulator n=1 Tax=Asticcacaulis sp. AC460 TaxID=1282360 RepID=UPI0003F6F61F|nr:IclR family transcriptional regulator [Asticcacaulis sp. AC460]
MKPAASTDNLPEGSEEASGPKSLAGAQTLVRGLDVLMAVADSGKNLPELSEALGLTRSTTHRLATTLVEQRFLNFTPRVGYSLGPRLLELGYLASRQMNLARVAHDELVNLAKQTGDTVHLGILDNGRALYLDKVLGTRRIEISSRIGERQPLRSTGIGKALLLDEPESFLRDLYARESRDFPGYRVSEGDWLDRMKAYGQAGYALDLEENEDRIRCVAAPIRDAANRIIGSISVSSAAQYMDDARMKALTQDVLATVRAISAEFGWSEKHLK